MAREAADDNGKALWLTLALSWARLAEHAAQAKVAGQVQEGGIGDAPASSTGEAG